MPNFERAGLSEIYESRARSSAQLNSGASETPITHVKVKYIRTDLEEVLNPDRLVWCPAPYELPCLSLFFALLKYREVVKELNLVEGTKIELESFRFVHLDNIRGQGGSTEETQ